MNTQRKIALASACASLVVWGRKAAGLPEKGVFQRGGVRWELDLRQGIDFSIFLLRSFEPATAACYTREVTQGITVLDIGANIGAHSLKLAKLVGAAGRVICYEPTDYAFGKLRRNFELNPTLGSRATCLQVFLGDGDAGVRPDAIPSSWSLARQIDEKVHPVHCGTYNSLEKAKTTTVVESLKECGVDKVDFIKLDVDGFELPVLRGAESMLKRDRPRILMEFAPYIYPEHGYTLQHLAGFLNSLGYECRDLKGRRLRNFGTGAISKRGSINVLMVPAA